jgi:hypothetical protein
VLGSVIGFAPLRTAGNPRGRPDGGRPSVPNSDGSGTPWSTSLDPTVTSMPSTGDGQFIVAHAQPSSTVNDYFNWSSPMMSRPHMSAVHCGSPRSAAAWRCSTALLARARDLHLSGGRWVAVFDERAATERRSSSPPATCESAATGIGLHFNQPGGDSSLVRLTTSLVGVAA